MQTYCMHVSDLEWYVDSLSGFVQLTKYPGLMYFCMDDMRAIRSLIDTLRIPSLEPRVRIFTMAYITS
jgi:Rapamycin-insensitive companion of mTOR, N-term